ncbi:MAG: glycosyltransferase family 2 protein [Caldilineaceae bacterium]|nr:glycosyltransferase family 2 protein [Caldilineaceae bacterium]
MPTVTVIMPCYNRSYDLLQTLQAYERQDTDEPFEIIAIDDGSQDATFEILHSYQPKRFQLIPLQLAQNSGPSVARNVGLKHASSPLLIFVGDDIVPDPDLIEGHLRAHRNHPDPAVAILGRVCWAEDLPQNTLMKHIDGPGAQQFSYYYLQDGQEYDYRHFYTANISIARQMFDALDHWFDDTFVYAYEDPELAYRLKKHGGRIIYDASIVGRHYHYHSILSFSTRQQRCGRIAWIFEKKHPGVKKDILPGLHWHIGLAFSRILNASWSPTVLDRLESQALHLACQYEWSPNQLLDVLYLSVLDYFYYKGALESIFAQSFVKQRLLAGYALGRLLPALKRFVREAHMTGIELPAGFDPL